MSDLVVCTRREVVTNSLKVSEIFKKKHQHVLEAIRKVECSAEFSQSNFRPRTYADERGKTWPMFEVTRDGFSFLAMGFTGKRAAVFKERYISAFNQMERVLQNHNNLSWQDHRTGNKIGRRAETDTIARFVDYATSQGSQSARLYYMNVTKMTHQALNLMRQAAPQALRDTIDSMELSFLTTAEYLVQQTIEAAMAAGLPYKDIYRLAKDRVTTYAETLPIQRRISA